VAKRLPVVFVGHGSPLNAIQDNRWSRGFKALGAGLPRPRAILAVSAHWYVAGTFVTTSDPQPTIHDFGGFPRELYDASYPAAGDKGLADRVLGLLAEVAAEGRADWGLDHGTWSVLCHAFPKADIPVVQLSIDRRARPEAHLAMGRELRALRDEGILVMASGNVTHNLAHALRGLGGARLDTPDWAERFDAAAAVALEQRDDGFLVGALATADGRLAHPTPDHYLPLLYAYGASDSGDALAFPLTGFDLGSLSMRIAVFG
jgi:4,5-DOPA dioxygenase extradiol